MSPRTSEQFEQQREESKEKILAAALELFAKKGFASTSISAIAKEAGVSKGLMYNYFDSKDDLLKGVIIHAVSDGSQIFIDALRHDNAQDKLKALIQASFSYMKLKKEYYRLVTSLALQEEPIEFIQEIAKSKEEQFAPIIEALFIEVGIQDVKSEVLILGALMDGAATKFLIMNDEDYLDKMENILLAKYCK